MKYKDESNIRINKALDELSKVMQEEERGFIFAPMVQLHGDHNTFLRVEFSLEDNKENITTEEMVLFWATIGAIVRNFQTQVPEDLQKDFKEGFIPTVKMIAGLCFPSIKLAELK